MSDGDDNGASDAVQQEQAEEQAQLRAQQQQLQVKKIQAMKRSLPADSASGPTSMVNVLTGQDTTLGAEQ